MTVRIQAGRVQEYVNGSLRRSYGSDVLRVRVSGGSVFTDLKLVAQPNTAMAAYGEPSNA